MTAHGGHGEESWWGSGVLYQIYVRSFADSDGDGHGDLEGIVEHLPHLAWLGIDAIWLSPVTPSPNADWGYDVADYTSVAPELGGLEAFERLVAEAGSLGIRVLCDLVPNHTSDRHPWFADARSSRSAPHRDWYVWADGTADGGPPNNWRSTFGGPAWTFDSGTEQFYLHNFLAEQPDLNWWNEEVAGAFDEIMRVWLDRGIAGFRIDVANGIVKDRALRDNPPVSVDDHPRIRAQGVRSVYNMNRPEVHDVLRRWRGVVDTYDPPRILVGETWVLDVGSLMSFYGSAADELHLPLHFPFVFAGFGPELRSLVEATEAALPRNAWPSWHGSNHDAGRFPTRWCRGDERKVRSALVVLLTLRGTPLLYYGDEIGMPEVPVSRELLRDPVGIRGWPEEPGRDPFRTPMQWTAAGGFSRTDVEPWLPMGRANACNVADQRGDPESVLHLCRDLIALRRRHLDLRTGDYEPIETPPEVWAWRRGAGTVVALNCSDGPVDLPIAGAVLLSTRRERDGERVDAELSLDPWEAAILAEGVE